MDPVDVGVDAGSAPAVRVAGVVRGAVLRAVAGRADDFAADAAVLRVPAFFAPARFVADFVARFVIPLAAPLADLAVFDAAGAIDLAVFAVFALTPSESVMASTLAAEFFCNALMALVTARLSL